MSNLMSKLEYCQYLAEVLDEDIEFDEDSLADNFYALFQTFMPKGENVEKVFAVVPSGELFLERLMPIYEVTSSETIIKMKEGVFPGYFCPIPTGSEGELLSEGNLHLKNLIEFARYFQADELLSLLQNIKGVRLREQSRADSKDLLNQYLYDFLTDWSIENSDKTELLEVLNEAYYSVNCDYYLSFYLQYPRYKNKPETDFLKPYFNIWKMGYYCGFENQELIISK
jgi:hypothetical protein